MPDPKKLEADIAAIRALAEVLDDTSLSELEIERGDLRIRISRGGVQSVVAAAPAPVAGPAPVAAAPQPEAAQDYSSHPGAVTAPMVGTAYLCPSPGAAQFIAEGAAVTAGQTLLIVEAMKTMNEIKATKSGTVTKILARDAEPVEFGEALVIIE